VGTDIGDIKNRGFLFDYVSSPHRTDGARPDRISWNAVIPARTSVCFQIRAATSEKALEKAAWLGPEGPETYYTTPGTPIRRIENAAWIQYRAVLDTTNGASSPVIQRVEISFK